MNAMLGRRHGPGRQAAKAVCEVGFRTKGCRLYNSTPAALAFAAVHARLSGCLLQPLHDQPPTAIDHMLFSKLTH